MLTKIEKNILRNRAVLNDLKKFAFNASAERKQIKLLKIAVKWASSCKIVQYSDFSIEKKLSEIAKKHSIFIDDFQKNSFLHVMSTAYSFGGHTRLVEQWINASRKDEKHSIIFTNQGNAVIPKGIKESVICKNGEIIKLNESDDMEKALHLREVASRYEFVILYIHTHDIIPLLAFATDEFKRPIIFYNHADHLFWIGFSIADRVIELSHDGITFTTLNRGKTDSIVLPLPIKYIPVNIEKSQAYSILGINDRSKVIVSMAHPAKYNAIDEFDFICIGLSILENNPNTFFFVIGPDKNKEKKWQEAFVNSNGKFVAVGLKDRKEIEVFQSIADLYIDSFPFYSYTSMLEFASVGIPILSVDLPTSKIDVMYQKNILCKNLDELIFNATQILQGDISKDYFIINDIIHKHTLSEWVVQKDDFIKKSPSVHALNWDFVDKKHIDEYEKFMEKMFPSENRNYIPLSIENTTMENLHLMFILLKNYALSSKIFLKILKKILKTN